MDFEMDNEFNRFQALTGTDLVNHVRELRR